MSTSKTKNVTASTASEPEPSVMRLTVATETPEPGDLLIDARDVVAVIENYCQTERWGRIQVCQLVTKYRQNVVVMDKNRDVKLYWLKAKGVTVCPRDDG